MAGDINYKNKYLALRSKYMGDIDVAFRLGVEAGMQQAQQQQALDAQAQANEKEMQMKQMESQANGQPPQEGGENDFFGSGGEAPASGEAGPGNPSPEQPESPGAGGSELDQHINQLEGMIGPNSSPEIQKSLNAIISLRKAEKQATELKKSQAAISGIAKALHKPAFKIGVQASHNMSDNSKKAVTMQEKIVKEVMQKWETQESKVEKSLETILNVENLLEKK